MHSVARQGFFVLVVLKGHAAESEVVAVRRRNRRGSGFIFFFSQSLDYSYCKTNKTETNNLLEMIYIFCER